MEPIANIVLAGSWARSTNQRLDFDYPSKRPAVVAL